ncbi:MAG: LD-carboxypeptidase [Bdellovibrionota bacterium]
MAPSSRKLQVKWPEKLKPGSMVALVAPAFGFDPEALAQGSSYLESKYGVRTTALENVNQRFSYFAGTDERRLEELLFWLTNPEVDAVFAIRGGYGCARIYPKLIEKLKKHKRLKPKKVLGYSDLTILLNGLYQDLGWVTYHGPVVASRPFRDPVSLEEMSFQTAMFTDEPLGAISDEQTRVMSEGRAKGRLVGGCLSLLVSSLGTSYEIDTRDKILFIEDVDERPFRLDRMTTHLLHSGKLDQVRGIVFGQMAHCEPPELAKDSSQTKAIEAIEMALEPLLEKRQIPILYDFPAGHGKPQLTFPIGCEVELVADQARPELVFLESGAR